MGLRTLKKTYQRAPAALRAAGFPLVMAWRQFKKIEAFLRVDVWFLSGREVHSREEFGILLAGEEMDKRYWVKIVFEEGAREVFLGRHWRWQFGGIVNMHRGRISLLVESFDLRVPRWLQPSGGLRLPGWIDGNMELGLIDLSTRTARREMHNVEKRIRKAGFSYEVQSGPELVEKYYHEAYLPYLKTQFGEDQVPIGYNYLVKTYEQIEILMIKRNNECVAVDFLCYKKGNVLVPCCTSMMPGREEDRQAGALQAVYYYANIYLRDKSFKRIEIAGGRPFFNDGVLSWKKKWGLKLTRPDGPVAMRVRLMDCTAGVLSFFEHNPCIAWDGDGLVGIVFIDGKNDITPSMVEKLKRYLWPGIRRVIVYCPDNVLSSRDLPDGLAADGLELRSVSDLFAGRRDQIC